MSTAHQQEYYNTGEVPYATRDFPYDVRDLLLMRVSHP